MKRSYMLLFLIVFSAFPLVRLLPINEDSGIESVNDTPALAQDGTKVDLTGVNVAIYESYIDTRVITSRTALVNMFTWMNATVDIINTTEIENGILWNHEIFAIPEGLGPFIENQLGEDAEQEIRDWVAAGGSYIGVRGSAAIAVPDSYYEGHNETFDLNLFNGISYQEEEIDGTEMTEILINRDSTGPDLSAMPENMSILYQTGRYFEAYEGQEMIVIARYAVDNEPCMIASHYGDGTVFLSSPHFEYEENSDRDGTDHMDEYNDPDSEWPLMLTICLWLLSDSATIQSTSIPTEILLGVGLGVAFLIIGVIVFITKRR
ncbi:MAG: BPL-N domain-containing protein [Candidatus Hodarchaeota archaeon]